MKKLNHENTGLLYLLIAIGLWSTAEVVIRSIHTQIAPIQLAWVRFAIGGAFLLALLPQDLRRRGLRLNRTILLHGAWLSVLGIVATGITFQYALKFAGAGVVATVFGASPVMAFLFSRLLLGDPMTWPRFAGVVMGFLGIAVLGLSDHSSTFTLLGYGLAFFNAICFALFTVLVKRFAGPFGGLPISAICCAFGAIYMFPMVLWENNYVALQHLDTLWLPVLYISIGTTGLAYYFYFSGLERVDATRAISVILLKPPAAAALAAVTLGEPVTWNMALAMALILGGLYLVHVVHRYKLLRLSSI